MSEVLTAPEIEQRFPSEWILVDELQTDEHLEVLGGRVLFHSPDRDEVYRKAVELHPRANASKTSLFSRLFLTQQQK